MQAYSILFTERNKAELRETEVPRPGQGEVLVRVKRSTISSGTERANITGEANVTTSPDRNVPFPRSSGYSASGVVEQLGEGVSDLKTGDRVAVSWSKHSSYVCLPRKNVYRIDDDKISFEVAALLHIATFPMAAIRKCHFELGEKAMVMGLGILGQIAIKLLNCCGAAPLICADLCSQRRMKALRLGSDYCLDPSKPDFAREIKELCGGVNVAIEVTGVGTALNEVLDCMAEYGRVALLGCTRNPNFTVDYYHKVHAPGISLIGAHTNARPKNESSPGLWTTRDDVLALLRLLSHKKLSLDDIVEEEHSPHEAWDVYNHLINDKEFPVTQFNWDLTDR